MSETRVRLQCVWCGANAEHIQKSDNEYECQCCGNYVSDIEYLKSGLVEMNR